MLGDESFDGGHEHGLSFATGLPGVPPDLDLWGADLPLSDGCLGCSDMGVEPCFERCRAAPDGADPLKRLGAVHPVGSVVFLNDSCAFPAQELRAGVVRGGSRGVRSSGRFDAGGDRERFSGQHFECPAALLVVYGGAESFELVACHQHCPEAGNEAGRGDLDVVAGAADRP